MEIFAETAVKNDDYKKFWLQIGKCIKLGAHVNSTSCTMIAEMLRFHFSKSGEEQINLSKYVHGCSCG